ISPRSSPRAHATPRGAPRRSTTRRSRTPPPRATRTDACPRTRRTTKTPRNARKRSNTRYSDRMSPATAGGEIHYATSGLVRLTKPQLIGTLVGLLLAALLAAIDQTIVGTAEPRIIASLSGFDRYPWVATAYLLTSTLSVPIFAS